MQASFFDLDNRYASLSKSRDPLERLDKAIDWEIFRATLEQMDAKERKSKAARKATCRIRMFKMLLLQNKYNLSDEQLEYQATDRLSFSRFIGVGLAGGIPDSRTVWAFRDALKEHGLMDKLFAQFDATLAAVGVQLSSGQIIDATFVPVPIQRNSKESNAKIKAGEVPEHWKDQPDPQSKHSSQINERAYKGTALTEEQLASNKVKSQTRARVEHVFGYQENSMGGIALRSIGLARAKVGNALKNLTYNLCRVEILIRQKAVSFVRFATPEMGLMA